MSVIFLPFVPPLTNFLRLQAEPLRCFDDYAASEERRRRMWVFAIIPGHERSLGGPSFYPRLADEPASVLASSPDSCSFSYFC